MSSEKIWEIKIFRNFLKNIERKMNNKVKVQLRIYYILYLIFLLFLIYSFTD